MTRSTGTNLTTRCRGLAPARAAWTASPVAFLTALLLLASTGYAHAAAVPTPLGAAESFAVLAGAGVTNTGPTTVTGDLGTFPTTSVSGASDLTLDGTNHGGDAVTQQAKDDLVTAYDIAAAQGPPNAVAVDLGGSTLTSGVYASGADIALTGTLTLDAEGNPDAVFVFQSSSTLVTATDSRVELINGAQACNVYWQVASSATLGVRTQFTGTVIALTSITLNTEASLEGRALARNGAVTLDTNTITRAECATTPPVPVPVPTPEATPPAPAPVSEPEPVPTSAAAAPQVPVVPRGGVATGDGSTATPSAESVPRGALFTLAGAVALGAIAIPGVLAARAARRT